MGVRWDQAKNVPIAYNEEEADICMRLRNFKPLPRTHQQWNVFGLGDVERHIEQGDRATLTTKRKQSMKLTVACKVPMSRIFPHEYIHFNAQMNVQQICSEEQETIEETKVLSLLEFAYVPLQTTNQLVKELQEEGGTQLKLKNTSQKQWRPFCIGIMPEKPTEDSQAWMKLTEQDAKGIVWDDEVNATPFYAAWPVQAYIEGFRLSNNIALTYTLKQCPQLEQWIHAREDEDDSSSYSIEKRKVILKINGGTVVAYEKEVSPTRSIIQLDAKWEKEES